MSGANESPRQKMIGMMYLVLTALLALNVSSAILEKFIFLNDSLEYSVSEGDKRNQGALDRIRKAVEDSKRSQDLPVLQDAEVVRRMSAGVIKEIDGLKEELIERSGGRDKETGHFKSSDNQDATAILLVGSKKNGKAYALKDRLNNFSSELSKYNTSKFNLLALDGSEDPLTKNNPEQRRKDFAELNFAETPMVAALAVLSQKQSEIRRMESQALENLALKVGAGTVKFDKIFATANAESKVVAAGTKYRAQMYIAASSSGIAPTMKFNGANAPVDAQGKGSVEFVARAGNYDKEGNSKQSWKGSITFKNPSTGRDTTFTVEQEFIVAKPVIQIQSDAVKGLYLNCGNELNVQVPALGSTYDPSFSASGAEIIRSSEKGKITVIPSSTRVTLNVSSGGNLIGKEEFPVKNIPKPTVEIFSGGRPIDEKRGMSAPGPRELTVKAISDQSFKDFLPKDARYRVFTWEVTLARGSRPVAGPTTFTTEQISTANLIAQAKPGDRLVIEIKEVRRQNYKGDTEKVKIPTVIKAIALN